jgi:hypothetical protein
MYKNIFLIFVSMLVLSIPTNVLAAGEGWILNVIGTGGQHTGEPVNISSEIMASQKIPSSNLYYQIFAQSNNQLVASHSTNVPSLNATQHFTDAWSTSTAGWPAPGMYTINLYWNKGGSQNTNCAKEPIIHCQTTQIWAVPTLGWFLSVIGVGLILLWAWRRRSVFNIALVEKNQ